MRAPVLWQAAELQADELNHLVFFLADVEYLRPMAVREIFDVVVSEVQLLTPHVKKIVLRGEALGRLPEGVEGGYMKLLLPRPGVTPDHSQLSTLFKRSFTIRACDRDAGTITLYFALHETTGPAMAWAHDAVVGTPVSITGPGPVKMVDREADWFVLGGDLTALPALAVNLERLPADAKGHVLVEVPSEEEKVLLTAPEGVRIQWLIQPEPTAEKSPLADAFAALDWQEGRVSAWFACEFSSMKKLRVLLKEKGLPTRTDYLSSYWKLGSTDEEHKIAKKA